MEPATRAWWKDAIERLIWTFVQGALGVPILEGLGIIDLGDGQLWKAATAGGVLAALSFLKSLAATRLGETGTAQIGTKTYSYTEAGPGSAGDL